MRPNTGTTFGGKNGWGQAGQLITGDPHSMVTMQAQFDEPGTYTVQFSKQDNAASTNPIFAVATITWSVEGHFLSRQVNVADGVSVSGVGQAVKVIIQDATPTTLGGGGGVAYQVSVQCSKGVRGTNKQPPILIPGVGLGSAGAVGQAGIYSVPNLGNITIPIPNGVGIISTYITVFGSGNTPIAENAVNVGLTYAGSYFKQWDPRDFPDWVPITPGVTDLILQNFSGQNTIWSVAFGIDG